MKINWRLAFIVWIVAGLITMAASLAQAQTVCRPVPISGNRSTPYFVLVDGVHRSNHQSERTAINAAGDSLLFRPDADVRVSSDLFMRERCITLPETPVDTVPDVPADTTPPVLPQAVYQLQITPGEFDAGGIVIDGGSITGGTYFIRLERIDGVWLGTGFAAIVGVSSVTFTLDGFTNVENNYPYQAPTGSTPVLLEGQHTVTWKVAGTEPDSGSVAFTATTIVGELPPDTTAVDIWIGTACAWGELRCVVAGDSLTIALKEGDSFSLYATAEFTDPGFEGIVFAVLPNSYAEAQYDPARGWICVQPNGRIRPADTPNFTAGTRWVPPPTCDISVQL